MRNERGKGAPFHSSRGRLLSFEARDEELSLCPIDALERLQMLLLIDLMLISKRFEIFDVAVGQLAVTKENLQRRGVQYSTSSFLSSPLMDDEDLK